MDGVYKSWSFDKDIYKKILNKFPDINTLEWHAIDINDRNLTTKYKEKSLKRLFEKGFKINLEFMD